MAFLHPDPDPQQNCSLESMTNKFMRAWLNLSRMSLPMVSATCWLMLKSVRGISVPKQKKNDSRKFMLHVEYISPGYLTENMRDD